MISSFYSDFFNSDMQLRCKWMQLRRKWSLNLSLSVKMWWTLYQNQMWLVAIMHYHNLSLCKNVMNFVSKSNVISCYNALPCFDLFKVWMRWRLSFATAHMIKVVRWFVLTSPCFANRPLANFVRSGECARLRMVFTNQLKSRACAFSIKVCLIKYWLCKY